MNSNLLRNLLLVGEKFRDSTKTTSIMKKGFSDRFAVSKLVKLNTQDVASDTLVSMVTQALKLFISSPPC